MPFRILLLALLALASVAAPAGATPRLLPDSTSYERWRLSNGLEVAARHVPGAAGVAVTLAFRAGSGYDPARQVGLAELVADLAYYGAAGDVPARTPEEMPSLRPLGWGLQTNWRLSLLTEIVSPAQVPGVLQQAAARLRAAPDAQAVRDAARRVTSTYARRHFGDPELIAWYRVGELARGGSDESMVALATGKALASVKLRDVIEAKSRHYSAANGVLSLAGDLSAWDVHALVEAAFGQLPSGERLAPCPEPRAVASTRVSTVPGLGAPRAAVALFGPSLDDSLHASFFLGAILIGSAFNQQFASAPGGRSHFSYSLFDDPDLVRLYPEVASDATTLDALDASLSVAIENIRSQVLGREILDDVRRNLTWFLGGPLRSDLATRLRSEASGLGTLANGQASRVLWKGEEFWERYRARFAAVSEDHTFWLERIARPERQARLLMLDRR